MLTLSAACALLGCRDGRTARKRLAALGVPVVVIGGRLLVDPDEIRRALRAAARPLDGTTARPAGVRLAPGARLWDGAAEVEVGPRRGNGRPRGSRESELRAAGEAYGTPSASLATLSTSRFTTEEER